MNDATDKLASYAVDIRPWGNYVQFTRNEPSTVKIISVDDGKRLSLQDHQHRDEFWYVIAGTGIVRIGDTEHEAKAGDSFFIPRQTKHRASGSNGEFKFLEIAFGNAEEDDIHRYEDDFNRA